MTRATGFAADLFAGDELVAAAIQGRTAKEAYLDKIIKHVEDALDETLEVRPNMVVTGKEPEQTNIFLQALARAARDDAGAEHDSFNSELAD